MRQRVFEDPRLIAETINAEHAREPIDCVIASSTSAMRLLGTIRDHLRMAIFPMPDLPTLTALDNKHSFARICAACDVSTPETLFFATPGAVCLASIRNEIGYPCVVKPLGASGGDGVRVIASEGALAAALSDRQGFLRDGLLIQRFMPGDDVGLSVFAQDGEILNWATFYCDGFWSTRFADLPELLAAGRKLIAHTGYTGIANFDARRDPETGAIRLLECNPRFFRRVGASRHCGLDFVAAGLASLNLSAGAAASLTKGRHLSPQDLVTPVGIRLVRSGSYSLRNMQRDAVEFLQDPVPGIAAMSSEIFKATWGRFGLRRSGKAAKCPSA
ncbi:hypothetical protein [Methylobacterium nigriterrae]|uniref:ATP-binding protein n=1 Tax=Methylobacterium nigriterrae TaxID=3127512 RepID=UPI0030137B46